MNRIRTIFVITAAALAAAGCASTKLEEKPAPVVEQSQAPAPAPAPPAPAPVAKVEAPTPPPPPMIDALNDPNSVLAKRSVFFDFDKSLIKGEYQPLIEAHGRYMVEHNGRQIRIEGNCDERGGREYNLALGQRRADAVREKMELVGVVATRMETISFGKEKPKAAGHDEGAWEQNRRADLVYR